MDDLIERLRRRVEAHTDSPLGVLLREAADALEEARAEREVIGAEAVKYADKSGRLQAELDNRWAQGVHTCHDKCQRIACVLRRERDAANERVEWLEALIQQPEHSLASIANAEHARAKQLTETLRLARDLVEDWASYASEYFQKKHNLVGDLALLDAALRDHDQERKE